MHECARVHSRQHRLGVYNPLAALALQGIGGTPAGTLIIPALWKPVDIWQHVPRE